MKRRQKPFPFHEEYKDCDQIRISIEHELKKALPDFKKLKKLNRNLLTRTLKILDAMCVRWGERCIKS